MRRLVALCAAFVTGCTLVPLAVVGAQAQTGSPEAIPAREVEPVVLTGDRLPGWFSPPAEGHAYSPNDRRLEGCGAECEDLVGSDRRSAHNGTLYEPPEQAQTGVAVEDLVAYSYDATAGAWNEIPLQVDERFPYFLANGRADFSFYSHTDRELSYEWDVEEWAQTAGECFAEFPTQEQVDADPSDIHVQAGTMEDPVASLDADDEVVFMASDAGDLAPPGEGPEGTGTERQEIALVDPRDPSATSFVYLFTRPDGTSFDDGHYVGFERDGNADQWIDRSFFADNDPEKLGTSNTGYGPNLPGTVCSDPNDPSTARPSNDRFPRDGVTVTTDSYRWRASGRWMVRGMQVAKADQSGATGDEVIYGEDLIDRWKGRAFQQNPDSSISLVGFEDEQVNWEGNASTLGWLTGPVRAIREIWGADSGTNVTKTETFYRDSVLYRYRMRVHPIPPDGIYTSWDYNHDQVECYFNESNPDCVPIDGQNDDELNVDDLAGRPAYFDAPDPRMTKPNAILNWEQVSGTGDNGSLVYMFELKGATSAVNPLLVPYYRDDACFDDGTGDNPTPRLYPGEPSTDPRVYPGLPPCDNSVRATWEPRQGCFACHGVHFFVTGDTDNAFTPVTTTEVDGQQWQWAVPTEGPTNIGAPYANTVKFPLQAVAVLEPVTTHVPPPSPSPTETATSSASPTPSDSATPTPTPADTELAFTSGSATAGDYSDDVTFAARLTADGNPIAGETITFDLTGADGTGSITASTDQDGVATATATLDRVPGAYQLTARYDGSIDRYAPSATTTSFVIERETTTLTLAATGRGSDRVLEARLVDADSDAPVAGRAIVFFADGTEIGRATTDDSGRASSAVPARYRGARTTYEARFDGDEYYEPSHGEDQGR